MNPRALLDRKLLIISALFVLFVFVLETFVFKTYRTFIFKAFTIEEFQSTSARFYETFFVCFISACFLLLLFVYLSLASAKILRIFYFAFFALANFYEYTYQNLPGNVKGQRDTAYMLITLAITFATCGLTFPLPMAVGIYGMVMAIIAGIAANKGEMYRYPYTFRLIN